MEMSVGYRLKGLGIKHSQFFDNIYKRLLDRHFVAIRWRDVEQVDVVRARHEKSVTRDLRQAPHFRKERHRRGSTQPIQNFNTWDDQWILDYACLGTASNKKQKIV